MVVLSASGPIRKAGCVCMRLCAVRFRPNTKSGGGRGVAVRFRSDTKSERGGGGCRTLQTGLNNILYIYQTRQTKNYTTFEIAYNQPAYTTV